MVFSSPIFIFGFLAAFIAVYFLVPRKIKNLAIFIFSLLFYGFGEPVYIVVMLFSTATAFFLAYPMEKYKQTNKNKAKLFLILSVSLNIAALLFFKYYNFFALNLKLIPFFSGIPNIPGLELPIGISFYTFQIISYTADLYKGRTELQKNFVSFGAYVTFFPQLIAGPIVRYRDIAEQLVTRRESVALFASGVRRFCCGLSKKILLGDTASAIMEYFKAANEFQSTVVGSWMVMICFSFHIYFDFSGYSDMAIGLGRMFGFEFMENFNYPYISKSITEFWRRWHISLSSWFAEYIYIPLGGSRNGKLRTYRNIAIVWLLTGFWHGADWNYIVWGAYFCVLLIIEKLFFKKVLEKLPSVFGHIYALIIIGIGWIIFSQNDLGTAFSTIGSLFGIGAGGFASSAVFYELLRALPLLLLCTIACTPLPKKAYDLVTSKYQAVSLFSPAVCGGAFVLCIAYLVNSSYSPFLYFIF